MNVYARTIVAFLIIAAVFLGAPVARAELPEFAPCCVNAARNGAYRIDVSWVQVGAPNPGVTGYKIERALGAGNDFAILVANTGSSATTYADDGLAPNTTYTYRVYAINAEGVSPVSVSASATTGSPASTAVPGRPQNLIAAPASASSIQLSWSVPTDGGTLTGYRIERSPEGGSDFSVIAANHTGTSYIDTNLAPRATYGYRVTAINGYGPGLPTPSAVAIMPGQPTAPQNVVVAALDASARLSWNPPGYTGGDISGYVIVNTTTGSTTSIGAASSTTISGLVNGIAYSFTIAAVNIAGTGPASAAVTVTPRAGAVVTTSTPAATPTSTPSPVSSSSISVAYAPTYVFATFLSLGSRGIAVTELQKRLAASGVYSGPITGYFGPMTAAGVRAYQAKNGITATGGLGPLTRAALNAGR